MTYPAVSAGLLAGFACLASALSAPSSFAISSGGFGLSIKHAPEDHRGYVRMQHATAYSVCFKNNQSRRADAELTIDGLPMGTWRLSPHQRACIERPADDNGHFTFYRADSDEGIAVGSGSIARSDKGLIAVRFIPEIQHRFYDQPLTNALPRYHGPELESQSYPDHAAPRPPQNSHGAGSADAYHGHKRSIFPRDRLSPGVTGLSGYSDQRFDTAGPIKRDYTDAVTLELRLVHAGGGTYRDPRPLPGHYDRPAPPPVGY